MLLRDVRSGVDYAVAPHLPGSTRAELERISRGTLGRARAISRHRRGLILMEIASLPHAATPHPFDDASIGERIMIPARLIVAPWSTATSYHARRARVRTQAARSQARLHELHAVMRQRMSPAWQIDIDTAERIDDEVHVRLVARETIGAAGCRALARALDELRDAFPDVEIAAHVVFDLPDRSRLPTVGPSEVAEALGL